MKNADDFFQPLFSRARRVASPREYRLGGFFLAAMAVGTLLIDGIHAWPAVLLLGFPAVGSFRLASRVAEGSTMPPPPKA